VIDDLFRTFGRGAPWYLAIWALAAAGVVWSWKRTPAGSPPSRAWAVELGIGGLCAVAAAAVCRALIPRAIRGAGGSEFAVLTGLYAALLVLASGTLWAGSRLFRPDDPLGLWPPKPTRGIGLGVLAYLAAWFPVVLVHHLNQSLILSPENRELVQTTLREIVEDGDPARAVLHSAAAVLIIPVLEETIYRGFIQSGVHAAFRSILSERAAGSLAACISALFFAAVHDWFTFAPILFLGLLLGLLFQRTRNLWACMSFHSAHNLLTIVLALWLDRRQ
jgi:membrane protease YdiL (CAAX protease family)